ncbi:MAG: class I SAM-dependent methyltransferase [Nostoc sp.]|uniref:class I SAM-dependent methyltransferase n=1 Tax=unclassified Nostoc TaxID=2593658 RepID=UPI001DF975C7|nr:class I SAM-dependent methyltransferase [Nostoc sp. JL34]MBN3887515.1 class I SAM-dependent methyltransferase [Nostoc sp. JL34]
MTSPASDLLDKIRQQFDTSPYPRVPLDKSPKDHPNLLYIHNLVTSYYLRNQKVIDTKGKLILDAGCGTGYKSLVLAEANPGAKIVGIDISEESIKLAQQRLEHHGFDNTEFHVLPIQELPKLDYQFDYINCDELLYLFPDLDAALQAMISVLKPNGIIRSNLHSSIQRFTYFRAQRVFTMMGLMDENPEDLEMEIVVETMKALKDNVDLKARTWNSNKYEGENGKEGILMNYLFQGDKGYTISDMFMALKAANLEFISMVNWRQWDLINLFKDPENLPAFLSMSLPEISIEERLQLFELIHPIHRLIDFWCGHCNQVETFLPVSQWADSDWRLAKVSLHPQLKTPNFQEDLVTCITEFRIFPISNYLSLVEEFVGIDSSLALCLIPLLEQTQPMKFLVEHWKQFRPLDPITLKPTDEGQAFEMVQQLLLRLESLGYVMLERQS